MGVAMLGFKVAAPFSKDNLPLNHWVVALLRVHVESTRFSIFDIFGSRKWRCF